MNIREKISFIAISGVAILCIIISLILAKINDNSKKTIIDLTNKLKQYESVELPFKGELDSLKVNISYKDSIIKQIKIEYVKDVEWVKNMPDSSAVVLFHQLVWAESNPDRQSCYD